MRGTALGPGDPVEMRHEDWLMKQSFQEVRNVRKKREGDVAETHRLGWRWATCSSRKVSLRRSHLDPEHNALKEAAR